jgi:hypothetical protein
MSRFACRDQTLGGLVGPGERMKVNGAASHDANFNDWRRHAAATDPPSVREKKFLGEANR